MKEIVVLSLGSNLGDKKNNLRNAIQEIAGIFEIDKVSAFYRTSPVEDLDQDWFVNLCLSGLTSLDPKTLLTKLKEVEARLGNVKARPKGPRIIDIDIIFFGKRVVHHANENRLIIPHPSYRERLFVLQPLLEIDPDALDPVTGERVDLYPPRIPRDQSVEKMPDDSR